MKYIESFTATSGLLHLKTNKWISRIRSKAKLNIDAPSSLTEWKPIVSFAGGILVGTFLIYGLMKLREYLAEPPRLIANALVQKNERSLLIEIPDDLVAKLGIAEREKIGFYEYDGSILIKI